MCRQRRAWQAVQRRCVGRGATKAVGDLRTASVGDPFHVQAPNVRGRDWTAGVRTSLTQSARVGVAVSLLPAERVNGVVQQHMQEPQRPLLPHAKKVACTEATSLRRRGGTGQGGEGGALGGA